MMATIPSPAGPTLSSSAGPSPLRVCQNVHILFFIQHNLLLITAIQPIHKELSKMFANKQKIVREEFRFCSRTIWRLFANSFLRFLLHLSYYSFSIIFRAFILQLNTHCVSVTIYTFVPHEMYYCAPQYILSSK